MFASPTATPVSSTVKFPLENVLAPIVTSDPSASVTARLVIVSLPAHVETSSVKLSILPTFNVLLNADILNPYAGNVTTNELIVEVSPLMYVNVESSKSAPEPTVPTVRVYVPAVSDNVAVSAVSVAAMVASAIADAVNTPVAGAPNPARVCVANVVAPALITNDEVVKSAEKSLALLLRAVVSPVAIS